ncbi:hypothetical protein [Labilibaculum antarcticum]|uniref:Uncharacterized protein n=1 Tax=Labilibaculum antarcticum TaxID=1717717 RepID=A0A1Y1CLP4_9BACT|nr:hypothetical protein [Labilibaculum antarcticum]BAX81339.1 hypothetical protein ALGA_3034 [Labilibaculum antarcticum]
MSHFIDLDGILEKLVLLQHFSYGSERYCSDRLIGSIEDQGGYEEDNYWGWTKSLVSNYILECSIKLRVIQDTFNVNYSIIQDSNTGKDINLNLFDQKACNKLIIGEIIKGNFKLNLRESCNKIIHAVNVKPLWAKSSNNGIEYQYWNGKIQLTGAHGKSKWLMILDVAQWARAYENFIELLEGTDHYLGQDFTGLEKNS